MAEIPRKTRSISTSHRARTTAIPSIGWPSTAKFLSTASGRSLSTTTRAIRAEPVQRLFSEQYHREEGRGRLDHHPARRLRRQDRQLSADRARLELHGAA